MIRKNAIRLLAIIILTAASHVGAQQSKQTPRIAFLGVGSYDSAVVDQFRQGLREFGYTEGKNIAIEYRWADGAYDRLPHFAADLVRSKFEIIISHSDAATKAAKQATTTIPIVFVGVGDPVVTGLVASLARPGGNVTGISNLSPELSGKRLELLREIFPKIARVAVIWNPSNPGNSFVFKETQAASQALALEIQPLAVQSPKDLQGALESASKGGTQALVIFPDPTINSHSKQISDYAAKHRLPTVSQRSTATEEGCLISYGPVDQYRRVAYYVDKILKGTKPTDIPVEQATKFVFAINLKTAKQIGVTIPPNVLARADKVIR